MFTGYVNSWTSVLGTDIPFTTVINSNNKVTNNNGTLSLNKQGYYNVDATLVLSGTGQVIVSMYADGQEVTSTYAETTLSTDVPIATVSITDAVKCVLATYPNVGTISLRVDTAGVVVNGKIRVEYVQ